MNQRLCLSYNMANMDNPVDKYGDQYWYDKDGKVHRDGRPAVIYSDGTRFWFQHGKRHRTDGPAEIWPDNTGWWYLNGKRYTFDEWYKLVDMSDEEAVMIKLKYG